MTNVFPISIDPVLKQLTGVDSSFTPCSSGQEFVPTRNELGSQQQEQQEQRLQTPSAVANRDLLPGTGQRTDEDGGSEVVDVHLDSCAAGGRVGERRGRGVVDGSRTNSRTREVPPRSSSRRAVIWKDFTISEEVRGEGGVGSDKGKGKGRGRGNGKGKGSQKDGNHNGDGEAGIETGILGGKEGESSWTGQPNSTMPSQPRPQVLKQEESSRSGRDLEVDILDHGNGDGDTNINMDDHDECLPDNSSFGLLAAVESIRPAFTPAVSSFYGFGSSDEGNEYHASDPEQYVMDRHRDMDGVEIEEEEEQDYPDIDTDHDSMDISSSPPPLLESTDFASPTSSATLSPPPTLPPSGSSSLIDDDESLPSSPSSSSSSDDEYDSASLHPTQKPPSLRNIHAAITALIKDDCTDLIRQHLVPLIITTTSQTQTHFSTPKHQQNTRFQPLHTLSRQLQLHLRNTFTLIKSHILTWQSSLQSAFCGSPPKGRITLPTYLTLVPNYAHLIVELDVKVDAYILDETDSFPSLLPPKIKSHPIYSLSKLALSELSIALYLFEIEMYSNGIKLPTNNKSSDLVRQKLIRRVRGESWKSLEVANRVCVEMWRGEWEEDIEKEEGLGTGTEGGKEGVETVQEDQKEEEEKKPPALRGFDGKVIWGRKTRSRGKWEWVLKEKEKEKEKGKEKERGKKKEREKEKELLLKKQKENKEKILKRQKVEKAQCAKEFSWWWEEDGR